MLFRSAPVSRMRAYIGSGLGLGLSGRLQAQSGDSWERGLVVLDEGVGLRVSSGGIYVSGVCTPREGAVTRCISSLLMHLSLSLSLFASVASR